MIDTTNYLYTTNAETNLFLISKIIPNLDSTDRDSLRRTCRLLKLIVTKDALEFFRINTLAMGTCFPQTLSVSDNYKLIFNSSPYFSEGKKIHPLKCLTDLLENKEPVNNIRGVFKTIRCSSLLPKQFKERKHFSNASDYFIHLLSDFHDLFIALQDDKTLKLVDIEGKNLIHYAADLPLIFKRDDLCHKVLDLLFDRAELNLNETDLRGNTPLHLCAYKAAQHPCYKSLLSRFIEEALKRGFDFSLRNHKKENLFHITATYTNSCDLNRLIEIAAANKGSSIKSQTISATSGEGLTPICYALIYQNFRSAHLLLDHGAKLSESSFAIVQELLVEAEKENCHPNLIEHLKLIKARLEDLSEKA